MSSASRLTQLQDRLAARGARLQINDIVEDDPIPEFDRVGLELKAHRERKGHELDMAARVLRIKTAHIQAIEESRFADLPGKTYAIGFVRSYAEYLGLNPEDCIRRFKIEYDEVMGAATLAKPKKRGGYVYPALRDERRMPHGSLFILAGILVLGVWGGWYLSTAAERQFTGAETVALPPDDLPTPEEAEALLRAAAAGPAPAETAQADETNAAEAAGDDTAPAEPASAAEQMVAALTGAGGETASLPNDVAEAPAVLNALPDGAPQASPIARDAQVFGTQNNAARVILRARGDTWIRVEAPDGAVLFEETLIRGDSYRVPNRAGIILATRNAGAVEVLVDGRSLGPAGAVGEALVELPIDAETLRRGQ
jgi:cytoskeleton protein RodZ